MSKRPGEEKLDVQSQKKVKLSSQEIEVSFNSQEIQLKVSPIFLLISTIAPGFAFCLFTVGTRAGFSSFWALG
jgi:hypothetical protein